MSSHDLFINLNINFYLMVSAGAERCSGPLRDNDLCTRHTAPPVKAQTSSLNAGEWRHSQQRRAHANTHLFLFSWRGADFFFFPPLILHLSTSVQAERRKQYHTVVLSEDVQGRSYTSQTPKCTNKVHKRKWFDETWEKIPRGLEKFSLGSLQLII